MRAIGGSADLISAVERQVHQYGPAIEREVHVVRFGEIAGRGVSDGNGGAGDGCAGGRLRDDEPRVVDGNADGRDRCVTGGVTRTCADQVRAVGGGTRVPRDLVWRGGNLAADRSAVDEELHTGHGLVVGSVGVNRDVPGNAAPGCGRGDVYRRQCVGGFSREGDGRRFASGDLAVIRSREIARQR